MDDSAGWPSGLSSIIGAAIRSAREAENVSAVKLAKKTSELGYPIHRTAIANIEAGERIITIAELVILAAALNTSPLALLLDTAQAVEILPGNYMHVADALGWFTGTTGATPAGVISKRPERIDLMMQLNEVVEQVVRQKENLLSARAAATTGGIAKEHQDRIVKHSQELLDSLQAKRDSILHMLDLEPTYRDCGHVAGPAYKPPPRLTHSERQARHARHAGLKQESGRDAR